MTDKDSDMMRDLMVTLYDIIGHGNRAVIEMAKANEGGQHDKITINNSGTGSDDADVGGLQVDRD